MERKGIKSERERINREIIKRNASRQPAAVAEYINELRENFFVVDNRMMEFAGKWREADRLDACANDMEKRFVAVREKQERLDEAKERRKGLKMWQTKVKEKINTEVQQYQAFIDNSLDYFKNKHRLEFGSAAAEIERNRTGSAALRRELSEVNELSKTRDIIATEYQKQRLLAEIRPDNKVILSWLKNPPPQLSRVSDKQFEKILSELTPEQAKMLTDRRERAVVRSRIHERER